MIQTYLLESAVLPDPLFDGAQGEWNERLSNERMEKIRRIKHAGTRKQSFAAGLLLEQLLHHYAPGAKIQTSDYGKPFCRGIPFNLSHTADAVIVSICGSDPHVCIGCDIERIKPYERRIARRFFTGAEYESLEAETDEQAQAALFCRYWTKKESVMKLTGLGMSLPMDLYDVQGDRAAVDIEKARRWYEKCLLNGKEKPGFAQAAERLFYQSQRLFLKEYRYKDYCIAVCSLSDAFAPQIKRLYFDGQRLRRSYQDRYEK